MSLTGLLEVVEASIEDKITDIKGNKMSNLLDFKKHYFAVCYNIWDGNVVDVLIDYSLSGSQPNKALKGSYSRIKSYDIPYEVDVGGTKVKSTFEAFVQGQDLRDVVVKITQPLSKTFSITLDYPITDKKTNLELIMNTIIQKIKQEYKIMEKGKKFTPDVYEGEVENTVEVEDTSTQVNLGKFGSDLHSKFVAISSNTAQLTVEINEQLKLSDAKDLTEAFLKAREALSQYAITKPSSFSAVSDKIAEKMSGVPLLGRLSKAIKTSAAEIQSVQQNIDYLFGIVHSKYEQLVKVGSALQQSKVQFKTQLDYLQALEKEALEELNSYDEVDVPMHLIATHTQIQASYEKYKQRLTKIDAAILAVQATIKSLGKNLPALKTDLTEEMAIGGLLSGVDDYQQMYQKITELVATVTEATSANTHRVLEQLMDLQIKDTHTIEYLKKSSTRAKALATMLQDKQAQLVRKTENDARVIKDIVGTIAIGYNSSSIVHGIDGSHLVVEH